MPLQEPVRRLVGLGSPGPVVRLPALVPLQEPGRLLAVLVLPLGLVLQPGALVPLQVEPLG